MEDITGSDEVQSVPSSTPSSGGVPLGIKIAGLCFICLLAFFYFTSPTDVFSYTPPKGWKVFNQSVNGKVEIRQLTPGGLPSNIIMIVYCVPTSPLYSAAEFAKKAMRGAVQNKIDPWVEMENIKITAFRSTRTVRSLTTESITHVFERSDGPTILLFMLTGTPDAVSKVHDEFTESLYTLEF